MSKVIVLAGSREQFEEYLDKSGLTDNEAVYGHCPDVLAGITASKVVEIGTFYERSDAYELRQFAETRLRYTPQSNPNQRR